LVLLIPNLIIGAILGASAYGMGGSGSSAGARFIAGLVGAAIGIAYATYMESSRGQTVGKMALGLRVIGPNGGNPTQEEAFKRNAFLLFGIIPILGGLIALIVEIVIGVQISNDPNGRGLHDNFANGTMVVKT